MEAPLQKKLALSGLMPDEISSNLQLKPFQGKQIFKWIHGQQVESFDSMTNLSKELRSKLDDCCLVSQMKLIDMQSSNETATRKALLELVDGETVETVLIPSRDRVTICVSTQVGCALNCAFCATGQSGFSRNLNAGEIVEQVIFLLREVDLNGRTPNIVYMGMGEPLLNYEEMVRSIKILMHPEGLGIGARKITVSTAGIADGIRRFASEDWQVRLSISLHAGNNALRTRLMPLNRTEPLEAIFRAVRKYQASSGRQISFEWTLIDGVNDSVQDADQFIKLLRGLKCSVNLIPYNPVADTGFLPPYVQVCNEFQDRLLQKGINATLRSERGRDIDAACGQLRRRHEGASEPSTDAE